jgi:signal peptidase II
MPSPRFLAIFRSPLALLLFFGVAAAGVAIDLTTKSLAVEHLSDGPRIVRVIPHVIELTYTANHGAVFGLGQGQRMLFLLVSIGAILFLLFLFATSERARIYQLILGMLLAGVIGNMYDRLTLGYVRDMIHGLPNVFWPEWVVNLLPHTWQPLPGQPLEVFPWIFNIADSMLCIGVASMLIYSFVVDYRRKRIPSSTNEEESTDSIPRRLDPQNRQA